MFYLSQFEVTLTKWLLFKFNRKT